MIDSYKTIQSSHQEEIKEKASKFIAFAFRVNDSTEIESCLIQVKNLHPKATHHCYAYQMGLNGDNYRANDDGEPSGTAGKPILGQIRSFGLTNVLIIVVRYYGGTKLGASGLIQAYKDAAWTVLNNCSVQEEFLYDTFKIYFQYDKMGSLINELKNFEFEISDTNFDNEPYLYARVRQSKKQEMLKKLKAKLLDYTLDRVNEETKIEGISFELL